MIGKFEMLGKCALVALAIGCWEPAAAQVNAGRNQASEDSTWEGDIIVTARRREETAQETPVAMTVLNEALLDRYAVHGIDNIASLTPGFFTGETSGAVGGSISLRGVGSGEAQAFIDQAVSVNVDGIPISTAQILRAAQMDLQQIEVLRGPQALFFGKNSPGGIISITTASPGDTLEAMARGGYEFDAEEWYLDGTLSAPITDTVGVRLAAHYSDMNGYINVRSPVDLLSPPQPAIRPSDLKAFPNKKELFLRGTVVLEPTDRLDVNLKGTYVDTKIKGSTSYFSDITHCPYPLPQEIYPIPGNCKNDGVIYTAKIPVNALALNPLLRPDGHRRNKQWLLSGTVNYELTDALKLTSVTGYYKVTEYTSSNGGYGLAASNVYTVEYWDKKFSEELRLASDFDGPLDFLIGGFFENRKLFTRTYIVIPTFPTPPDSCPTCYELPYEGQHQDQKSYSLFGQLLFDATDQVQITAGGRYTHEVKKLLDYFITTEAFLDPAPIIQGTPVDVTSLPGYAGPKRLTFNNFSPEVTVTYKPQPDIMFFASFKQGYKSGGIDGAYTAGAVLVKGVNSFKPEKVTGGEIGMKSTFADRQLLLNLTGYWYDYNDLQVTTYDTAARSFGTGNAAKSRVRGVEVETVYRPNAVPGLDLHASAAYNDAKFREFFAQCYKSQNQALGCTYGVDVTGKANTQDLSGVQLRKAPKFTATAGGYYETPAWSGFMMSFSADLNYSSKYNYGTDYQPYTVQKAFAKLDASFRLFTEDKKWELAVIGRNLTNKRNLINGIDRTGTGGAFGTTAPVCTAISPAATPAGCIPLADVIGTAARPRSVAVQLTYRY